MKQQTPTKSWKVRDFNEFLCCPLCDGYMINPTVVDNCLHLYCRSCIVKHLLREPYCPQCKFVNGKPINATNLKSDDVLRALIYKLVPGLYQNERERATQFAVIGASTPRNGQHRLEEMTDVLVATNGNGGGIGDCSRNRVDDSSADGGCSGAETTDAENDDFFSPTEPISLSLEYHPALLKGCNVTQIPPVRYLQCPAGVKMRHLKRFLCSKFDIDPESKRIEVEVIYEDEVLPNDFSLMDVGYCYNWKRHAPMKFTYRIRFYGDELQQHDNDTNKSDVELQHNGHHHMSDSSKGSPSPAQEPQSKSMSVTDETSTRVNTISSSPPATALSVLAPTAQSVVGRGTGSVAKSSKEDPATVEVAVEAAVESNTKEPVKVIIARKFNDVKKTSPKRATHDESLTYTVSNDFKSLRSNDMRYSDYTVTSTTTGNSNTNKNKNSSGSSPRSAQRAPKTLEATATAAESANAAPNITATTIATATTTTTSSQSAVAKCDIVVSIPQSQMPKSPYSVEDEYENVSLAQLKTASKKSANTNTLAPTATPSEGSRVKNVPKLKIELNTLKTKLSISKPKSAGVLHDATKDSRERIKPRKHSLDEPATNSDRLDLETYAKNIGLQPIEVLTPPESAEVCDKFSKYSPNASPLSTSSTSTTGSSNGAAAMGVTATYGADLVVPSFHKKRKKKHSKDSKDSNGKRRRMHAEISSQPAEESLKMKVKLTTPHNHKMHKTESKKLDEGPRKPSPSAPITSGKSELGTQAAQDHLLALNKTLCEESKSINNLMMSKSAHNSKEVVKVVRADETILIAPKIAQAPPKPVNNVKEMKLPASPPLPPSLFKTSALSFKTLNNQAGNQMKEKHATKASTAAAQKQNFGSNHVGTAAAAQKSHPHFVVPNLPRRATSGNSGASTYKYLSTPSSIASSTNKQLGIQLKRSASLDESYTLGKQQRYEPVRKSVYNAFPSRYAQLTSSVADTASSYAHNPAISICKISDNATTSTTKSNGSSSGGGSGASGSSAVTITARSRQQLPWHMQPYSQSHSTYSKPVVEIVRITSNQLAAELQPPSTRNPPQKSATAPAMGPPLSLTKGRKQSGKQLDAAVRSPPLHINSTPRQSNSNASVYRTSPPALVNLRNAYTNNKTADAPAQKQDESGKTNGVAERARNNSLRHFRRSSRDNNIEILDVTCSQVSGSTGLSLTTTETPPIVRDSLEVALNKLKQNITSTTVADSVSAAAAAKQAKLSTTSDASGDDLQNLHLLSESATAREKITIRSSQAYEKLKSSQPSLVRQQNASVRNIPNPSALAFRNMATLPAATTAAAAAAVTAAAATTTATTVASSSPATVRAVAKKSALMSPAATAQREKLLALSSSNNVATPLSPNATSVTALATSTTTTTATPTSTTTTAARPIKKPTTIDQVAANLNMRAAAAEANAAKLNAAEEAAQISSSTPNTAAETNGGDGSNKKTATAAKKCSSPSSNAPTSTTAATTKSKAATEGAAEKVTKSSVAQAKSVAVTDGSNSSNKLSCSNNNNNTSSSNNNNNTTKSSMKAGCD